MKSWVVALLGVLAGMFVAVAVILFAGGKNEAVKQNVITALKPEAKKEIFGYGYLRGSSHYVLKNKYAAFVSKVHVYADTRFKKHAYCNTCQNHFNGILIVMSLPD